MRDDGLVQLYLEVNDSLSLPPPVDCVGGVPDSIRNLIWVVLQLLSDHGLCQTPCPLRAPRTPLPDPSCLQAAAPNETNLHSVLRTSLPSAFVFGI